MRKITASIIESLSSRTRLADEETVGKIIELHADFSSIERVLDALMHAETKTQRTEAIREANRLKERLK